MWELEETIIRSFVKVFGRYTQGYQVDYTELKNIFRIMEYVPNLTTAQQQMLLYKLETFNKKL